jgi:beta-glucosidase
VKPLFSFGFGLPNTSFRYSGISVERVRTKSDFSVAVDLSVTSVGDKRGSDVPQIYVDLLLSRKEMSRRSSSTRFKRSCSVPGIKIDLAHAGTVALTAFSADIHYVRILAFK